MVILTYRHYWWLRTLVCKYGHYVMKCVCHDHITIISIYINISYQYINISIYQYINISYQYYWLAVFPGDGRSDSLPSHWGTTSFFLCWKYHDWQFLQKIDRLATSPMKWNIFQFCPKNSRITLFQGLEGLL